MARARKRYKPAVKAKIVEAAAAARAAGKPWKAAYAAAQKIGYKGSVGALTKMMGTEKTKAAAPAQKKRGRPPKVAAPAVPALDPVAAQYLVSAIDKAVAELQTLRKLYAR